jgi:hypothetical protein
MKAHNARPAGAFAGIVAAILLASCGGDLATTVRSIGQEYNDPTPTLISGPTGSLAIGASDNNKTLTWYFSKAMAPDTLVLGGSLGATADEAAWTPDYTGFSLTPSEGKWAEGEKTLTIACADREGSGAKVVDGIELSLSIFDGAVYVRAKGDSASDGASSHSGSKDSPLDSIPAAIAKAEELRTSQTNSAQIHEILVAEGSYDVYSTEEPIVMLSYISLIGGYDPMDWSKRNPQAYPTNLVQGSTNGDVITIVASGSAITSETIIDGFIFKHDMGAATRYMIGCYEDAAPTIRNCVFVLGAEGDAGFLNAGMIRSVGIDCNKAYPLIYNDVFDLDLQLDLTTNQEMANAQAVAISSGGISNLLIYNCTIYKRSAASGSGVGISYSLGGLKVKNCIISLAGGTYDQAIVSIGNIPNTVNYNDFYNCTTLYTNNDTDPQNITTISALQAYFDSSNIADNPKIAADSYGELDSNTPASVSAGGANLSAAMENYDLRLKARTSITSNPWSMGAYEYN